MKYTVSTIINKPIDVVVELFDNEENMFEWMEGLKSVDHLEGEKGKAGAKSMMKFELGKRKMEIVETILESNLPERMVTTYASKGVNNIIFTKMEAQSDNTTKYIAEQEFKFKGLMKLMGWLMPGAFKKQSQKYLEDFKKFAESN